MVSACAGCNVMEQWAALVTGVGSGVCYYGAALLVPKLGVDDPLDAAAVHMGGGLWGLLSAPLLMRTGVVYGGGEAGIENALLVSCGENGALRARVLRIFKCAAMDMEFDRRRRYYRVDDAHYWTAVLHYEETGHISSQRGGGG